MVFIATGALDDWPGWLALAITLVSWLGLLVLMVQGFRAARQVQDALGDLLPVGDPPRVPWSHVLMPVPHAAEGRHEGAGHRVRPSGWPGPAPRRLPLGHPDHRSSTGRPPGPRWRMGHRRQAGAGHPAAGPPGGERLGGVQRQLPPEPGGDLPRPPHRPQAGGGVDPGARRRVRRRPGLHRRHRGIRRGPPDRAAGPDRRRSRLPARLRGRRHLVPGRRALLRRLRLDQPAGGRPSRPAVEVPRALGDEGVHRRRAGEVPGRVADRPGRARRPAVLRRSTATRTRWRRSRTPASSSSACGTSAPSR